MRNRKFGFFLGGGGGTYQQRYPFLSLSMDYIYDSNNLWTLQFLCSFALYSMITIMWPLLIFLLVSLLSFYFWKCMYQNYSLNTPTCNIAPAKQWLLVTTPIMNNYCITTLCKWCLQHSSFAAQKLESNIQGTIYSILYV